VSNAETSHRDAYNYLFTKVCFSRPGSVVGVAARLFDENE